MKSFLSMIKKHPLEIFFSLAFAGLFLRYPNVAMANLLVLSALVISGYLKLSTITALKNIAPLPLLASLAMYYFLPHDKYAYLFLSTALALMLGGVFITLKVGLSKRQSRLARSLFVVGMAVMLIMPLAYIYGDKLVQRLEVRRLSQISREREAALIADTSGLKDVLSSASNDPFIWQLLGQKSYSDLTGYVQNMMVSQGLGYLTLADCSGSVVGRAHQSKMIGDDLSELSPKLAEEGKYSGVVREAGNVYLVESRKVADDSGQCLGFLMVGESAKSELPEAGGYYEAGEIINIGGEDSKAVSMLQAISANNTLEEDNYVLLADDNERLLVGKFQSSLGIDIILAKRLKNTSVLVFFSFLLFFLAVTYWLFRYYRQVKPVNPSQQISTRTKFGLAPSLRVIADLTWIAALIGVLSVGSSGAFIDPGINVSTMVSAQALTDYQPSVYLEYSPLARLHTEQSVRVKLDNLPSGTATVKTSLTYPPDFLEGSELNFLDGPCDQVFDKSINNSTGSVSFSCVLKYNISSSSNLNLFEVVFKTRQIGVASFFLDENDTSIRSPKGDSDYVRRSYLDGEKMLIGN